jgi:hypothetical protein
LNVHHSQAGPIGYVLTGESFPRIPAAVETAACSKPKPASQAGRVGAADLGWRSLRIHSQAVPTRYFAMDLQR